MNPDSVIVDDDDFPPVEQRGGDAEPIGDVLAELLARYQAQYPELNLAIVELPSTAVC